jgi:hypothetical protein
LFGGIGTKYGKELKFGEVESIKNGFEVSSIDKQIV